MAIRKISELPLINPLDTSIRDRLQNSYVELSFADKGNKSESYTFASRKVNYLDLEEAIIQHISGTPDEPVNVTFYTTSDFIKPVFMRSGLRLSGDVYINDDIEDVEEYELSVNMGAIVLKAPTITLKTPNNDNPILIDGHPVKILDTSSNETSSVQVEFWRQSTQIKNNTYIYGDLHTYKETIIENEGTFNCKGNANFEKIINGTALYAKWADLAEMYDSDNEYDPGTLVKFGGDKEITIANDTVNAVITTKPGLLLGEKDTDSKLPIALVGKVPVKVIGRVKKFDKLVLSDKPGIATVKSDNDIDKSVIGIALETIECDDNVVNLVNSVVQMQF